MSTASEGIIYTPPGGPIGWRAWYAGGVIWEAERLEQTNGFPREGCVGFVIYYEPPFRDILDGQDWYFPAPELPRGVDGVPTHPEIGQWAPRPMRDIVIKSAPHLADDDWEKIQAEMIGAKRWR